jgi:hypothetical protein
MKRLLPAVICVLLLCVPAAAVDTNGVISVISSPNAADVYVDGVFAGVSNNAFANIPTGERTVRVVKAGYTEYTATLRVGSSTPATLSANLHKTSDLGGLVVESAPDGASVYLDDVFRGTTHFGGLQIAELPPGEYTVRLELDGYKPYTVTDYMVQAGSATYLTGIRLIQVATATRTPANPADSAGFVLDSSPSGSAVSVDGVFSGYTPLTLDSIPEGTHTIRITHSGYADWESVVTEEAGDIIRQTAVLTVADAPPAPTKSPACLIPVITGLFFAAVLFCRK